MHAWELVAVIGLFLIVIGVISLIYAGSIIDSYELYRVSQSGGSLADLSFTFPMLFGGCLLGMGIGCLVCTFPIYKLETSNRATEET